MVANNCEHFVRIGLRTENLELKVSKVTLLTQLKKAFASLEEKEGQMKQMMEEYKEHMLESDETIRKVWFLLLISLLFLLLLLLTLLLLLLLLIMMLTVTE